MVGILQDLRSVKAWEFSQNSLLMQDLRSTVYPEIYNGSVGLGLGFLSRLYISLKSRLLSPADAGRPTNSAGAQSERWRRGSLEVGFST